MSPPPAESAVVEAPPPAEAPAKAVQPPPMPLGKKMEMTTRALIAGWNAHDADAIAKQYEPSGKLVEFARAAFEAYFGEDHDISQDTVLAGLCARIGVDPAWFFQGIAQPAIKAQLKANTDELIARGGFGSPTMFVDGEDMYFGNDALPLVRAALTRGSNPR